MFKDTILKDSIEKGECRIANTYYYDYIKCPLSELGNTTSIIINNNKFTFSTEIFKENAFQNGVIATNCNPEHKVHNFTGIILGSHFLIQFNYKIFDYENKQIGFYSDITMITSSNNKYCIIIRRYSTKTSF